MGLRYCFHPQLGRDAVQDGAADGGALAGREEGASVQTSGLARREEAPLSAAVCFGAEVPRLGRGMSQIGLGSLAVLLERPGNSQNNYKRPVYGAVYMHCLIGSP